jgi:arylsulfatase
MVFAVSAGMIGPERSVIRGGIMSRRLRAVAAALVLLSGAAFGADPPNILVLWGDDIGISNLSIYSRGLMGYHTPNIDRIGQAGMLFTDYYGEQSCTAGRSTFITGQSAFRTGLSKVGVPGADIGISDQDPTIAELLRARGYATGQFGKNHLGDKDKFLPTNHGFDEFLGNLYHLNAEEEPENEDYPKDPAFRKQFGPRGVIHSSADGKVEDTGPLTRKRMETVDEETTTAALDFIDRAHAAKKPFFVWWNATHMHFRTYVKPASRGQSGQNFYADAMIDHDKNVGALLDKLDALGIADNTIVIYSTDNGPHKNTWPDAAASPFRSEKNTNYEGGWRVPALLRWPGHIKPGTVSNDIMHHLDWFPTLLAAAGDPNVTDELLQGMTVGGKTYKVHLDGYNFLPYFNGAVKQGPRNEIFYISDDGDFTAVRVGDWKTILMEQRAQGTMAVWSDPFVPLRLPKLFNLRRDPYETADVTSNTYWDWVLSRAPRMQQGGAAVLRFLQTFREFPPRQKPASFTVLDAVEQYKKSFGW